jgi:hypothetical protein
VTSATTTATIIDFLDGANHPERVVVMDRARCSRRSARRALANREDGIDKFSCNNVKNARQCQAIQTKSVVNTDVQKTVATTAFARSLRLGTRASWPARKSRWFLDDSEIGSRLIGLSQR